MFSIAHLYNSACSYAIKPIRIQPIFMSIIFHHYKQLLKLKEEKEDHQRRLEKITAEIDSIKEAMAKVMASGEVKPL
jgi:hypothetical protein